MLFTSIIREAAQFLKSADRLKEAEWPEIFDAMRIALDDWKNPKSIAKEVTEFAEIATSIAEIMEKGA